ncbi:CoA transferase [Kitasatospora sp. NPDC057223]|uniref:CoA transferase n=1 Tax=Kitasatospora sp. NPDC057223 TaxID=3346055 RepID=UPI00363E80F1
MAPLAPALAAQPLDAVEVSVCGPAALTAPAVAHLRALGARPVEIPGPAGPARFQAPGGVSAELAWADLCTDADAAEEATVQAVAGIMHVHGRRDGEPRGLATDYAATCASVLTVQGLLAALVGQARGGSGAHVRTGADRAALLTVSQYLAAAGAPEDEAVLLAPGSSPPFTAADGTRFELEALDPGLWAAFWRALGAPSEAVRSGWRPFQFRYATACAPLPEALHAATRAASWAAVRRAAAAVGADVCRVRTLAERAGDPPPGEPWSFRTGEQAARTPAEPAARPAAVALPLAGLTVLEAGRRVQAPLAAHLLGLLGADVIRIEPPGGDPLRGMPPCCDGVSARWLALNRGKRAEQIDIKTPAGQHELRELAAGADVFLHNWAPGKAEQLGLDADALGAVNPGLVYAYTGGWAGRLPGAPLGTDFMVQARTGVADAARPADEPLAPSLMTLLDVLGGLHGAEAVLAALLLRERTGRGVRTESSLLGAAETLTGAALRQAAAGGDPRRPAGFRRPLPTADGWVAVADDSAAGARAHTGRLRHLGTTSAVALLRARGLTATAVTTDLRALPADRRLRGALTRDSHGALAVPTPWRFS